MYDRCFSFCCDNLGKYYAVTQGMEIRSKSTDPAVTNYLLNILDILENVVYLLIFEIFIYFLGKNYIGRQTER